MFGYVRPNRLELKVREEETYRAAYCGLCRCLGKRYGLRGRFLINYDMTFLYLLLSGLEDKVPCQKQFCPARPLRKKPCLSESPAMAYTADLCVIFCTLSLRDHAADTKGIRRLPYQIAYGLLHGIRKKAKKRQPEFYSLCTQQLDRLAKLEAAGCSSMDEAADAFATLLSHCADPMLPQEPRPYRQLLYHVGRYLYLTDALDDLEKDAAKGCYNPILKRFFGALSLEDREYCAASISQSITLAASSLALCELRQHQPILENILYLGLPGVLHAVKQGTFKNRKETGVL